MACTSDGDLDGQRRSKKHLVLLALLNASDRTRRSRQINLGDIGRPRSSSISERDNFGLNGRRVNAETMKDASDFGRDLGNLLLRGEEDVDGTDEL